MERKIIISKRFRNNVNRVHQYLIQNFSKRTAALFLDKIEERVELITKYPTIGKLSQKKDSFRSVILTPHNLLFYRITNNQIELLCLFDARRKLQNRPY